MCVSPGSEPGWRWQMRALYREPKADKQAHTLEGVALYEGTDNETWFDVTFNVDIYNEDDIYLDVDSIEASVDGVACEDVPAELVEYLEAWLTESLGDVWKRYSDAAAEERAIDRWESRRSRYDD